MTNSSPSQRKVKVLVFCALLAAMSIVLGKYLAFNVGMFLRFSLENMPVIFAGVAFGPIAGALVGTVADIAGSLMVGFEINPLITVGAAAVGFVSGFYRYLPLGSAGILRLGVTVGAAHVVGSVIIKTLGLYWYYNTPLIILMLWRTLNYVIVGAIEWIVLYRLLENKSIKAQINSLRGKRQ